MDRRELQIATVALRNRTYDRDHSLSLIRRKLELSSSEGLSSVVYACEAGRELAFEPRLRLCRSVEDRLRKLPLCPLPVTISQRYSPTRSMLRTELLFLQRRLRTTANGRDEREMTSILLRMGERLASSSARK